MAPSSQFLDLMGLAAADSKERPDSPPNSWLQKSQKYVYIYICIYMVNNKCGYVYIYIYPVYIYIHTHVYIILYIYIYIYCGIVLYLHMGMYIYITILIIYPYIYIYILVGGLEHFSIIYGTILPIDELIFFRGVQSTNQIYLAYITSKLPFLMGY